MNYPKRFIQAQVKTSVLTNETYSDSLDSNMEYLYGSNAVGQFEAHDIIDSIDADNEEVIIPFHAVRVLYKTTAITSVDKDDPHYCEGGV